MNNPFKYLSPCLFFFLLFISAVCQGQVVVENPSFSTTNTRFLEIEKVELQDTVTILHVKGFNHPRYWIRIAKTAYIVADGNKYVVQRSEGMKLDKKEYTNDKGEISCVLYFAPIPKGTRTIDFVDGDEYIWGIELKSGKKKRIDALPKEFAKVHREYKNEKLPAPSFKKGTAVLTGLILNREPEFKLDINVYHTNVITGMQTTHTATIDSSNRFRIEVPMVNQTQVLFRMESGNVMMLNDYIVLSPDEESRICIDLCSYARKIARLRKDRDPSLPFLYFCGANAALNNQFYIHDLTALREKYFYSVYNESTKIAYMSATEYKNYILDKQNGMLDEIAKMNTSDEIKRYFTIYTRYLFGSYLFYPDIESHYRRIKKIDRETAIVDPDYSNPVYDAEYYSFLKDLPLTDSISLLFSPSYPINACQYVNYSSRKSRIVVLSRDLELLLDNNLIEPQDTLLVRKTILSDSKYCSDEELEQFKALANTLLVSCSNIPQLDGELKRKIESELPKTAFYTKENLISIFVIDLQRITQQIAAQEEIAPSAKAEVDSLNTNLSVHFGEINQGFSEEERTFADNLSKKYKTQLEVTPFLRQKKILSEQIGAIEGLFFDIMLSQSIGGKLSDMVPFDKEPFALSFIKSDFIIDQLREENTRLIAKIEDDKKKGLYNVNEVPPGLEDFFEKIIQSYKGKKILVDFWATWCGPCKSGMKDMEPKKKELQDKGIVFLYFAGENSPKKDWENYIPTVSGEHFRVTKQQWDELQIKFGIKGIPFYLIYNENGELIHRGHSNAETLINKLK